MALNTEYGELYGAEREELMNALQKVLDEQGRSFSARGVSGRARSEAGGDALDNLLRQLSTRKGQYGVAQLGREQQVSDVEGARKYETQMTYAEYAEQKKRQERQFQQQKELMAIGEQYARERESRAKKDARKNMIRSAVTGVAAGALAGWANPKAVAAEGSPWTAALRGATAGASAVGTSAAFQWMFPQGGQSPGADYKIDYSHLMPGIRPRAKSEFSIGG